MKSVFVPKRESLVGGAFETGLIAGVIAERERIIKAVINNSTHIADLYKVGLVDLAEELLLALIKGENK